MKLVLPFKSYQSETENVTTRTTTPPTGYDPYVPTMLHRRHNKPDMLQCTYMYQGVTGYNVVNYYMYVYPTLTSSADTDGMTHSVTFHLDLHRL